MAEAAVEDRPAARFYCHMCNIEFQNAANNFTCPHCSDGFIEELHDDHPDVDDLNPWRDADFEDAAILLGARLGARGPSETAGAGGGGGGGGGGSGLDRHQLPLEHLVHDFIINLGVGVNLGAPNVQFLLGNPGDYAWGREGIDAIVTQLLNQMDSSGPPPVSKAVIDALQIVDVTQEQVGQKLQCSVCWEHFQLKEPVRQLPCFHIYHEICIRPWLELHGTCPICRQNLTAEDGAQADNSMETSSTEATSATGTIQDPTLQTMFRSIFGASPSSSRSNPSSGDQSGSSNSSPHDGNLF